MKNKVCVVTGASSGIGKVTARALSEMGATVLLVCRNREKGEATLREIRSKTKDAAAELFVADLSSQDQIKELAADIETRHSHIDVLVNNAGAINPSLKLTADNIETTFAVNHLTYFLLANLLLDQLKAPPAARVINVSSQTHRYGTINFDDLGLEQNFNPMKAYAQSKLANLMFTYELSRHLAGTRVTVNALHPGGVATNFGKNLDGIAGFFFRSFGFLLRSPERGAETVIWLATAPELEGVTGKYFFDKKEIRSSKVSYDDEISKRLWHVSEQLTGLRSD